MRAGRIGWLLAGVLFVISGARGDLSPALAATEGYWTAQGLERVDPSPQSADGGSMPVEWVPPITEVVTLHLQTTMPLPKEVAPHPLHNSHPGHRPLIAFLLDLLSKGQLAPGPIAPPIRGPILQITLRNGTTQQVRAALTCDSPLVGAPGGIYTCRRVPDQVILRTPGGWEVRLHHPQMAAWLREGWQNQLPLGEQPDLDQEMAIAIARERSRLERWRATFMPEYPVERQGQDEVRRAWVLETELPAGHKIRLVLDAKTGEVLRLVQQEALP